MICARGNVIFFEKSFGKDGKWLIDWEISIKALRH